MGDPVVLLIVMLVLGGMIVLEVYLARKKNKWLGLLVPLGCFILALVCSIGLICYDIKYKDKKDTTVIQQVEDSQIETEAIHEQNKYVKSTSDHVIMFLYYLILANIPTYMVLAVYASTREKMGYRKKTKLEESIAKIERRNERGR